MIVRAAIRDELTGPLNEIRDELRRTAKEAESAGRKATIGSRGFDAMARGAAGFVKVGLKTALKTAAAGLTALTAAAAVGSVKVLQMASDAAETASAFRTVFKGVGGNVDGFVKRMNTVFGISSTQVQQAMTTFGVFGKAAGVAKKDLGAFTKDLTVAGLDLSSFYNADPGEVFQALRSGLSGEAEPLRQFGIFLSDATMKAEAATLGLTGELTESQKVMVRQRIILKSLGDAEGDLARTKDGLANKTRALKGRLSEAATAIGTALLPYAEKAANALDRRLGPAVGALPDKLKAAEDQITGLVETFQSGGIDAVVGKLDDMTGAGGRLETAWDKAKAIADDLGTIVTDVLMPAFNDVKDVAPALLAPLTQVDDVLDFMADHADTLAPLLTAVVAALAAAKVATMAYNGYLAVATVVGKIHAAGKVTEAGATGAAATAQWSLNAALLANPVGLVIAAVALLVGGFVLLYKKSDTFRDLVDKLWNNVLKPFGKFLGTLFIGYIKLLAKAYLMMGEYGVKAFRLLLTAAFAAFDGILSAAEKGLGWIPGLGDKIRTAREKFDEFGNGVITKLKGVEGKLKDARAAVDELGKDRKAKIEFEIIPPSQAQINRVNEIVGGRQIGDTATSRARGKAGNFANTLAAHQRISAMTGARPRITNAFVGGGGHGHGSGDHQAGRALDLVGRGLAAYGAQIRAEGGYAAFHGTGATRHLHAVPAGDTTRSYARPRATGGGSGGVAIEAGAVTVTVTNPGANVDVAQAVADGIRDYVRDREERA